MQATDQCSLWSQLSGRGGLSSRFLSDGDSIIRLADLASGSSLAGREGELRGRSVLLAASSHLAAALALIELDGWVRRLVLCPPDLAPEHVPFIVDAAEVDAMVTDRPEIRGIAPKIACSVLPGQNVVPLPRDRTPRQATEWILLTSGTTGRPKLVLHTLATLTGAIQKTDSLAQGFVWSTFYDIRRYGGLQVFLRALLTGGSLVLSNSQESVATFLARLARHGVTHISGTPSHWRKAIMSPEARQIDPQYVRLSGEIADQSILDSLRALYPSARIAHAFASTEAGVAFDVRDGLAGFPASLIQSQCGDVEMKVENGSLHIRSPRTAARYLTRDGGALPGAGGFVDTGDMLELRGDRYYFVGRRDGVINVGGLKVHPEEVEAVIGRHPGVRMALVRTRKNPITGSIVVADVVPNQAPVNGQAAKLEQDILRFCREMLPAHKVPAAIRFLQDLPVSANGKLVRSRA